METHDGLLGAPPAIDPHERAQILASAATSLLGEPQVRIDRFEIRGWLGGGALGVVYTAWDPRLEREVAIKLLRGSDEVTTRLLVEARAMARLAHPNVVSVHEVGVADGRVYLVMEHVRGRTLREWLTEQPRSWREVVAVFAAGGRGLAAAHRAGLIHRDFKPDNVLVAAEPGASSGWRVLVGDFGLAVAAGDVGAPAIGTLAYMAPEQHEGASIGPGADQFAFCVALYEALWQRRPFASGSAPELARDKAEARMIAPPQGSEVPAWLREVVVRGLAPDPPQRWPSMDVLVRQLESDPARVRLRRVAVVAIVLIAMVASVGATLQGIVFWRWYLAARP